MGEQKASRYLRIKVRELFPPDELGIPELLRLMAAVNDLRTLNKFFLFAQSREAKTRSEERIISEEYLYLFRLLCAALYEAAIAFADLTETLASETGSRSLVAGLSAESRAPFRALTNLFPKGFEKKGWGNLLCRLRQSTFHYPKPKEFRKELGVHGETADIVVGEIAGISRYLLADTLLAQMILRPTGLHERNKQEEFVRTISEATRYLGELVDGLVMVIFKGHESAIVEERAETIDIERLWNIRSDAR